MPQQRQGADGPSSDLAVHSFAPALRWPRLPRKTCAGVGCGHRGVVLVDSCARLCFGLSAMRDEPMSNGDFTSALVF